MLSKKNFSLMAMTAVTAILSFTAPRTAMANERKGPRKIALTSYKKKASLKHWPKRKPLNGGKTTIGKIAGGRFAPLLAAPTPSTQTFEGALLYSGTWTNYYHPYGVATFQNTSPTEFKQIFENEELPQSGGGFFTDKYYYLTTYSEDYFSGELAVYTYVYSRDNWEEVEEMARVQDVTAVATDLSYDAIDDVAYGCFYSESGNVAWGYMNPHDLSVTHLAELPGDLIAVAVNSRGEAYAITSGGFLVKVNKKTGQLTAIGDTGLQPAYLQSATFAGDGVLYWAASLDDDTSGLYTVNLTTGQASLVAPFQDEEEVVALYARPEVPADGAPAQMVSLALSFAADQLAGSAAFTIPTKTADGNTLTGLIDYVVTVDGEGLASGKAAAGENVVAEVSIAHAGYHYFVVTLSNEAGKGTPATLRQWIGIDEPKPVTNVVHTKTGEREATITWEAPTASVHGGYFSADRLSYTVTRLPEGKVVATGLKENTYIDNVDITGQALVRYSVTALADDVEGAAATSNGIIYGDAFEVPVHFTFENEEVFNLFTAIDNNETPSLDSGCWLYSPSGQVVGYNTGTKDGDDWFITPAIMLKADRQYTFQYDVCCYSDYWPDEYAVYMGNAATEEGMTTQLLPTTTIYWEDMRTMSFTVTVPSDGAYYFGFYATSEAGGAFFLIDDIRVEESYRLKAPAEVADLAVVAGENGSPSATVSFIAPEKSVDGTMLTSLTSIDVKRGGQIVKTFSAPEPGERLTFTETELPTGMMTYEVVAQNAHGTSPSITAEAWVGIDYPSGPLNVKVSLNADGHPVITWQQPEGRGAYGGYVDNSSLTYTIYKTTTGQWLQQDIIGYSYVDEDITTDDSGDQSLLEYAVFGESAQGLGRPATAFCIDGAPYSLPFSESFAGTKPAHFWAFYGTNGESWNIGDDWSYYSQDEDDGLLAYLPAVAGSEVTAFSGKIAIKGTHNPVLSFYLNKMSYENNGFYETNPDEDEFLVQVAADCFDLQTVKAISMGEIRKTGYQLYQVPLDQFTDNEFIIIAFTENAVSDQTPIMLDNIRIESLLGNDLALSEVNAPASVEVLDSAAIKVTVKNNGSNDAADFSLELYRDGLLEQTKELHSLERGATTIETFEVEALSTWDNSETFTVKVVYDADEAPGNNESEPFTIEVIRPDMPLPTGLAISQESGEEVTFSWTAPSGLEASSETTADDFEAYRHGDRTFGDWTSLDAALFGEYGIMDIKDADGDEIDFPHYDEEQAFMVFSPASAFIDIESNPQWAPHSGKKMLISICDYANSYGSTYRNNDWLISPQLDGSAQTITFYARTASANERKDYLEVRYSTTDSQVASFLLLPNGNIQLQTEWTRYDFTLPEGTLFFALRNNTDGGTGVLVDDISFSRGIEAAGLTLLGYNLYRDGEQVNNSLITTTTFVLTAPENGSYTVTAVYNVGESEASDAVAVIGSGILKHRQYKDNDTWYDLQGRPVTAPIDGRIYISRGRKAVARNQR